MTDEVADRTAADDSSPPPGPMALLRIPAFGVLYTNSAVVFLGVMAQSIARGWLAFELTGSNAALGGVLLAFGVATLLFTPWAGVVADRLPKRLVLQVAVGILAGSSAWIGLAVVFDVMQYWMLLGAGVLQAIGFSLFGPARMALLGEIVPRRSLPLAVSMLLVNAEVNRVAGPALAGVVIGAVSFGVEAVFLASGVLAAVGVVLMAALPPGRRTGGASTRSPFGELVDGLRYVGRRRELSAPLWCGIGVTMAGMPYVAFMPTVASELFAVGSVGYGVLSATAAVGAVAVGLWLGRRSTRRQTGIFLLAGLAFGIGIAALAVAPVFWVAVVVLLVVGGGNLAFQTANQSLLLSLSDMAYHGRIQSLVMLSFGAFGIAALPLGVLADAIGLRLTLGGMSGGVVLVMVLFWLFGRGRVDRAERLRDLG